MSRELYCLYLSFISCHDLFPNCLCYISLLKFLSQFVNVPLLLMHVQVPLSSVTSIIDGLKRLYIEKLKPLEVTYRFNDFAYPLLVSESFILLMISFTLWNVKIWHIVIFFSVNNPTYFWGEGMDVLFVGQLFILYSEASINFFSAFDLFNLQTNSDFDARPMVMLLGQYSTGKTTFIRHLLRSNYPGKL